MHKIKSHNSIFYVNILILKSFISNGSINHKDKYYILCLFIFNFKVHLLCQTEASNEGYGHPSYYYEDNYYNDDCIDVKNCDDNCVDLENHGVDLEPYNREEEYAKDYKSKKNHKKIIKNYDYHESPKQNKHHQLHNKDDHFEYDCDHKRIENSKSHRRKQNIDSKVTNILFSKIILLIYPFNIIQ